MSYKTVDLLVISLNHSDSLIILTYQQVTHACFACFVSGLRFQTIHKITMEAGNYTFLCLE